jgi:hypothetical protein
MKLIDHLTPGARFVYINKTNPMPYDEDVLYGRKNIEHEKEIEAVPQYIVHEITQKDGDSLRTKWAGGTSKVRFSMDDVDNRMLIADMREPIFDTAEIVVLGEEPRQGYAAKLKGNLKATDKAYGVNDTMQLWLDEQTLLNIIEYDEEKSKVSLLEPMTGLKAHVAREDMFVDSYAKVHVTSSLKTCYYSKDLYIRIYEQRDRYII